MKNMSAWAIRHPITPLVMFVVLGFLGIVAFVRLPINLDPDVAFPLINVLVSQPGAAPTELETQVTQKVEAAIASVGNVRTITSRATEGQTTIFIEFQLGTDVDRAVNDIRDAVAKVRSDLPQGIEEPLVQRIDIAGGAIAYFAVGTTDMTPEQLSWFVDNNVAKRLLTLSGVAQVSRGGGVDREIRVELDPNRMQALGLTAVEVNNQLRQLNLDAPGGRASVGGGEQAIRVLGGAKSAVELGDFQVATPSGKVVRLADFADVHDGVGEIRSISRHNGRDAVTFGVFKARGSSDVAVMDLVAAELKKVAEENPKVVFTQVFTTVENTRTSYHSAIAAMLEGSVLAVAVVWLFLRNWRATAISALAIPLSAMPTFAFMQFMGFTLNQITLLALSLVAGVLVDDAIVEIENIVRHMRMGKSGYQAALDAADEIGLAVVATSATIIAVFLPVSFMSGISGQYFRQFGLTVAMAVFLSLLVARLITPVLAAFTLNSEGMTAHGDGPVMRWYLGILDWCIRHRWKTILGGVGVFVFSVVALALMPKSFSPDEDFSASNLQIELPPGVQLAETSRISAQLTAIIRKHKEVTDVVESLGEGDDGQVRRGSLYISLVPPSERMTQKRWENSVLPELHAVPDARVTFENQNFGGGRDITIFLTGDNPQLVDATARQLVKEMHGIKELRDPRVEGDMPRPEIVVKPRQQLAAELGVTVASISETIRIATIGELPQYGAKFSLADRQVPIRVSLLEDARKDLATIENLPVPTANGGSVPLKTVADISFGQGPSTVRRYNQSRRASITSDVSGSEIGPAQKQIDDLPTLKHLPEGVHKVDVGTVEFMKELFANFTLAIGAGVLLVFAVLVLLFARVFQPMTILSALPLSLAGAVLGLLVTGFPFSMPVVIGLLMLMGIVGKNSILLVDFAIEEMRAGRDRRTAILESGHKRARPIVMTTVAMVAGMVPAAIGIGDNGFRASMAVAVIGGLITSTMLTLVVVPAVFTFFDDVERWVAPRASRILTTQVEPEPNSTGLTIDAVRFRGVNEDPG